MHMPTGDWRLETEDWRLRTGDWRETSQILVEIPARSDPATCVAGNSFPLADSSSNSECDDG